MSRIKNALDRLHKSVSNFSNNETDEAGSISTRDSAFQLGGCVFSIGSFKIFIPGYFRFECESSGAEFKNQCNEQTEFCYKGAIENRSQGSFTKSDLAPPGGCQPRYPNQPVWDTIPPNSPPPGWFGGGNDCGDPYVGWSPECREKFKPVTINSKVKPNTPDGRVRLPGCPGSPTFPGGEVPVPIIEIIVDTRGLQVSPRGTVPAPGFHVEPGAIGPPADGGIWRGYRPGGFIVNPKFIDFLKDKLPNCLDNYCLGGLVGIQGKGRFKTPLTQGQRGTSLIPFRCSLIASGACNNNPEFANYIEKYFPALVSGGSNVFECEKALCQLMANQYDHIAGGNSNQFDISNALGPDIFHPRNLCPILTGIGNLSPAQQEIQNKCSQAMDFVANLFNMSKPSYSPYPLNPMNPENSVAGLENGCYNCLIFINPNTGDWLPLDFPWPKTQEEQLQTLYLLSEKGHPVDWACEQGCNFEWLCNVRPPAP